MTQAIITDQNAGDRGAGRNSPPTSMQDQAPCKISREERIRSENTTLAAGIEQLRAEVTYLENILAEHTGQGCSSSVREPEEQFPAGK